MMKWRRSFPIRSWADLLTATTPRLGRYSISGITESTFVCHRPCHPRLAEYSAFRELFSRGDGHWPLRAHKARTTSHSISITSISPCQSEPTSTSSDTHRPPRSPPSWLHRCYRVLGGPCIPNRHPFAGLFLDSILQSACL